MLIYIIKALSKGNYLYTDTALVVLLFNYDVFNVISNDIITFALYLGGVPVLFIHIDVIKLIISVESVN